MIIVYLRYIYLFLSKKDLFIIRTFLDTQRARCYDHARNVYLFEYINRLLSNSHMDGITTLEGMYQLVFE